MTGGTRLLTTEEAAERLCLSARTLERYRASGEGPKFRKIGRWVRYTVADLEAWIESRKRSSTSDDDGGSEGNGR